MVQSVLASIIVVSLKSMLQQIESVPKIWRISKWDAMIWIVTFCATVIVSVDIGLIAGIVTSIISLLVRGYDAYTCILGVYPKTDLYLDVDRYKAVSLKRKKQRQLIKWNNLHFFCALQVREIEGIKIFHYCGNFNFASHRMFKETLYKRTGFNPTDVYRRRKKLTTSTTNNERLHEETETIESKCIIVDLSACTYIDHDGVNQLRSIQNQYKKIDVVFYLATCSGKIKK